MNRLPFTTQNVVRQSDGQWSQTTIEGASRSRVGDCAAVERSRCAGGASWWRSSDALVTARRAAVRERSDAHRSSVARRRKPTAQQRRPVAAVEVRARRHDMHLSLQRFRYAKLSSRHACTADVHCASNDTRRARRRRRRRRCAVASRILCRTRSRSSSERPRSQARVASVGDNERSARFVCVSRSQLAEQTVELCRYLRSRRRAASAVQLSILQVVAVEPASAR